MAPSTTPKAAAARKSARERPRRDGRTNTSSTAAASPTRRSTTPAGPASSKSLFANALPNCTEPIPPSTSTSGGTGRTRTILPAPSPSFGAAGRIVEMRTKSATSVLLTAAAATVLSGLAAAPALAQAASPGATGGGDPYFPRQGNGGYNVGHYDLRIAYTPASHHLAGVATIRARATQR